MAWTKYTEKRSNPTVRAAWEWLIEHYKEHCEEFVRDQCKIEDRDSTELIVPFALWPAQAQALEQIRTHKHTIILKARQLGLTWLALAYAVWVMIRRPGAQVIALSRTEAEAKELVRRVGVLLANMPEIARPSRWEGATFALTALSATITMDDAASNFVAFPSAAQAARSFTANLLILDEWAFQQYAREIWAAAYPTINRPTGGQVIGLSTICQNTLFTDIWQGDNDFAKVFIPWYADPRRTEAWRAETERQMGPAIKWEYPATVEDAFSSPEGKFFPELDASIHLATTRPQGTLRRYVSIDYGLDALAALYYEVDTYGNATIYKEVYKSGLIVSDAARAVMDGYGRDRPDAVFAPPDLWNRNRDTGRSTAEIFAEAGCPLVKTSNNRVQGWLDVKEWLKVIDSVDEQTGEIKPRSRMMIIKDGAPELWRCLNAIRVDEHNPNDAANDPHELTHLPDSLRAFCAGRPISAEEPVEPPEDYISADEQMNNFLDYW